jgi:hypothetical protein
VNVRYVSSFAQSSSCRAGGREIRGAIVEPREDDPPTVFDQRAQVQVIAFRGLRLGGGSQEAHL